MPSRTSDSRQGPTDTKHTSRTKITHPTLRQIKLLLRPRPTSGPNIIGQRTQLNGLDIGKELRVHPIKIALGITTPITLRQALRSP